MQRLSQVAQAVGIREKHGLEISQGGRIKRAWTLIGCDQGHVTQDTFSFQWEEEITMIPSVVRPATPYGGFLRASPHIADHALVQRRHPGRGKERAGSAGGQWGRGGCLLPSFRLPDPWSQRACWGAQRSPTPGGRVGGSPGSSGALVC